MWRSFGYLRRKASNALPEAERLLGKCSIVSYNAQIISNHHTLSKLSNITYKPTNSVPLVKLQHTIENIIKYQKEKQDPNTFTYRTRTCGELRTSNVGEKVTLCGWVQFVRLSKFLLLRDAYGVTQCVVGNTETSIANLPLETIVKVEGTVNERPPKMVNDKMVTGEVEVIIDSMEVLNLAEELPFNLRDYQKPKEQLRMQYRYIDLRFPEQQNILRKRSEMLHNMRKFLVEKHGFVEVETPTLFCRTPGGAREFVVPTHHAGLFYSLVQSPQQFKQMLMSGGIDRYFQVARCYRDESTRPDRQPEFTQLDIELSFTNMDGVLTLVEYLMYETYLMELPKPPYKRLTYREALENYGSDKPDLRYDLILKNIKELFPKKAHEKEFQAFVLPYPSEFELPAEVLEKIGELTIKYNTKFLLPKVQQKALGSYFVEKLKCIVGTDNNSVICLGWGDNASLCLGELRQYLAPKLRDYSMLTYKELCPVWVVDFPLFVKGENGLDTCHHPFTAPHPSDIELLETDPLQARSLAYDLVINGLEVAGGSVRVHNVKLQEKLLDMMKLDKSQLSHFIHALKSGCPPHAGIALGIDRLMSIACNTESIRDVIAFPKSHGGKDLVSGAPTKISADDKKYYHIETVS